MPTEAVERAERADDEVERPGGVQDTPRRGPRSTEELQRGKRMLGMLNSTLAHSREPKRVRRSPPVVHTPPRTHDAPQEDLAAARRAHDEERAMLRADQERVQRLAEELAAYEAVHRTVRLQKRRLSSFPVTQTGVRASLDIPAGSTEAAVTAVARVEKAPIATKRMRHCELYYLPRMLLPTQEDTLDRQEEEVDDAIDRADDEYDAVFERLEAELVERKQRLAQHGVEIRASRAW
ncbi:hypothetical protein MVES1_000220 [Malassezia vespertilionis]|uniref:Pinin/SDK/MemA protein domain-containing protein n=1 Tax=Malassezia vespertilionis TaxID=2020962 RepID=A0A2N1JHK1_9BASI|nr:uncharacterized protein MVES1_000220 [Malassezia vespertilionis]PKI86008.1 hypothetical protein MVES_000209 [Malassezia vespertilionis]WFD04895.1 hypothetical protein MVES1_000220 [Malassezia vespertilionis]